MCFPFPWSLSLHCNVYLFLPNNRTALTRKIDLVSFTRRFIILPRARRPDPYGFWTTSPLFSTLTSSFTQAIPLRIDSYDSTNRCSNLFAFSGVGRLTDYMHCIRAPIRLNFCSDLSRITSLFQRSCQPYTRTRHSCDTLAQGLANFGSGYGIAS